MVLNLVKYQEHNSIICIDLKMGNFLLGQQSGYTKYPCFLCLWDSSAKDQHCVHGKKPERQMLTVRKHNLPKLDIRLDLMKQFVKTLAKDGACFQYISDAFPSLSAEQKQWIFLMGHKVIS